VKPEPNNLTSFGNLPTADPAVESLLGQGERRQAEARLPKQERQRKKKERERARKRLAGRVNLDLPPELKKRLEALAKKEGVPLSQLIAFLLYEPLHRLEARETSLWGYKLPSGCPKFEFTLDLKRRAAVVEKK
jgi:predicted HicB family RNase H-like nuclease